MKKASINSKATSAYEQIKDKLFWGAYPPGTFLQERQLCDELGISRTPVREALLRLVDQGLLQQIPNRGILVPEITISDIIELYDLRKVNDGLAASLFAQQATEEQLIEAQGVLDTAMKAVEEHDFKTWRLCEWQFHDIYIQGIGNGRLKKYLTNLSEQINMVRDESLEPHVLLSRVHDHQAILDAFVARNSDVAEQRAREHWESLKKYWMERYLRLNL